MTLAHAVPRDGSIGLAPPSAVERGTAGAVGLEALFAAHGRSCYALARSVLRDPDMAQDAVQEAFLEHWRNASFDAGRSSHRRWLLMLTHRKAVDRVRHEQLRTYSSLEGTPEPPSTLRGPDDLAMASWLAPRVRAALATLPEVQQRVLALAYWGGYTQVEIASITQSPLGTVKTRTRNALMALREALVDVQGPPGT